MGHENPKMFPIKTLVQTASHVYIGKLELGTDAKSEITDYIDVTSDTRPDDSSIKLHLGLYYHCNDVFNPEIGDIRLRFLTAGIEGNYVSSCILTSILIKKKRFQNLPIFTIHSTLLPPVYSCCEVRKWPAGAICIKPQNKGSNNFTWSPYIRRSI